MHVKNNDKIGKLCARMQKIGSQLCPKAFSGVR